MTSAHVIYIPLIVFAGVVLGYVLGRRSADVEKAEADRRVRSRAERVADLQKRLKTKSDSVARWLKPRKRVRKS